MKFMATGKLGQIRRALAVARNEGAREFLERGVQRVRLRLGIPSRKHARYLEAKEQQDALFDAQYKTDTSGIQPLHELLIDSESAQYGVAHNASPPDDFTEAMLALDISLEDFTFVDLGSGKGRALIMASHYPFKGIIGVEFARELHETARRNARVLNDRRVVCVHDDAGSFELPEGNLLLYMYNPFDEPVVRKVAAHALASYRADPREIWMVYLNPRASRAVIDEGWSLRKDLPGMHIFSPAATP
jgi:hypothetical protein